MTISTRTFTIEFKHGALYIRIGQRDLYLSRAEGLILSRFPD